MIGLSRDDLRNELRQKLETAVRDRLEVEGEKSTANKAFNDALKAIDSRMLALVAELDECGHQDTLPFAEQKEQVR